MALRTLRQRPKVVGSLADGEPIYEVRSVRLVLRGQTPHFSRLVACERCGRDQAGAPVLAPADLDAPLRPMICSDCVRRAGVSSVWEPEIARVPAERALPQPPREKEPDAAATVDAPGDGARLQSVDVQLEAVANRVEELARLAEAQQTTTAKALEETRAEVTAVAQAGTANVAALEGQLRESLAGLTRLVEEQRADLTAVVSALSQVRTEMGQLTGANRQLAEAHDRLEQRVVATARPAPAASAEELSSAEAVLDERLQELAAQVAEAAARMDAVAATAEQARSRLESVEQRRAEERAAAQAALDQRLHELAARVAQATARMDTLVSAADHGNIRLDALDERLDRLAGRLAESHGDSPAPAAGSPEGGDGVKLLEALELQLRGASDRLAALSAIQRPEGPKPSGGGERAANGGEPGVARQRR